MSKAKAHIVLTIGDILVILGILWGCNEIMEILINVDNVAESISFSNRVGFFTVGIALPIAHVFSIFENFWHDYLSKRKQLINSLIIIFGIVLFAGAIFISIFMQHYVKKAGYQYCAGASGVSALAKELVYTIDDETCRRLTAERREMLGLPPK